MRTAEDYFAHKNNEQFEARVELERASELRARQALHNAGWENAKENIWRSPSGSLFLGLENAFNLMLKYPHLNQKHRSPPIR